MIICELWWFYSFLFKLIILKSYVKTNVENAASVKAQAPKREAKHIELTKAQYEEMLALCKAGKGQFKTVEEKCFLWI